jgi:hypothetical protein
MPPASTIPLAEARAAIIGAQFPGGSDLAGTIARTGFIRTLGGIDVYLAIRARLPAARRAHIDAAVVRRELVVVPAVRGCIYLVSERDVDVCLSLAEHISAARTAREHERAGITDEELRELGVEIVRALGRGPLTTDALRRALPEGAVRKLSREVRHKLGLYSTLSPALRKLELERRVERVLDGGRLDSERYLWRPTGRSSHKSALDAAALRARVAEAFFDAAAIARLSDFAEWAGITLAEAQAAVEPLGLKAVAIEHCRDGFLATRRWRDHVARGGDVVAFLPFEDNVPALHGGASLLVDAAFHGLPVPVWGGGDRMVELGESKHMMLRTFLAEGRIAGVWEYDPDRAEIIYAWFSPPSGAAQARLRDLAYATASFIHGELGHGRAVALDTDDALRGRVKFVRGLAGSIGKPARAVPVAPPPSRTAKAKPAKAKPAAARPAKAATRASPARPKAKPAKAKPASRRASATRRR